jgi:hypothetical protein
MKELSKVTYANPVKDRIVTLAEDYYFSSAINHTNLVNDIEVVVLDLF